MNLRLVLLSLVALSAPDSLAAKAPNVLFLISDDLNNQLGCYGSVHVKTPNLDKLAARGVKFEHAYCQFPLCGPSRNSMLTGLYPNSTGILRNSEIFRDYLPSHHSLSQAFRLQGYFAGRIGKLYHYNVPKSVGTNGHDDPGSWELELNPAGCDRLEEEGEIFSLKPGSFGGTLSWYASPNPDERHTDAMLAADAEWVLERCAREKRPFFLAVGFYRPHTPYVAPKSYFDPYKPEAMPVVPGWEDDQKDIPAPGLGSHKNEHDLLTDELRRKAIQAYFASITFMDAQVGRVIDLYPTLTELAKVEAPETIQGQSLAPMLDDPSHAGRGYALTQVWRRGPKKDGKPTFFNGYSIRTPSWRYTEWDGGEKGRELYDHSNDPREITNLADDPSRKQTVAELSKRLRKAYVTTFAKSGNRPPKRAGIWAPNLTNP